MTSYERFSSGDFLGKPGARVFRVQPVFQMILLCVFVLCLRPLAKGEEPANIISRLDTLAKEWSVGFDATPASTGRVTIEQSTFRIPHERSPKPIAVGDDTFVEEFDSVSVQFLVDFRNGMTRCRWTPVGQKVEVGAGGIKSGAVLDADRESESILTGSDFFHHPLGSRVSGIAGGLLPDELEKLDRDHRTSVENGKRRLVFRDDPRTGRAFSERSFVFLPERLFQIGGQRFDKYLHSVISQLSSGTAMCEDFQSGTDTEACLRMKTWYRSSKDSPPDLEVETIWQKLASTGDGQKPEFFPISATMLVEGGTTDFDAPNFYRTTWQWNSKHTDYRRIVPTSWTFEISALPDTTASFRRALTVNQWDVMPEALSSEFAPASFSVSPGDLILDRESGAISYIVADKSIIRVGKVDPEQGKPVSLKSQGSRVAYFWTGIVILGLCGIWIWRRLGR